MNNALNRLNEAFAAFIQPTKEAILKFLNKPKGLYKVTLIRNPFKFTLALGHILLVHDQTRILPQIIRTLQVKSHFIVLYPVIWALEYVTRLLQFRNVHKALAKHCFEREVHSAHYDTLLLESQYQRLVNKGCEIRYKGEIFAVLSDELRLSDIIHGLGELSDEDFNKAVEKFEEDKANE